MDQLFSAPGIKIDDLPVNVIVYRYIYGDFIIVDLNIMAEKTEGIRKKELIGKSLIDVFPGAKKFGLLDALLHIHKNGEQETLSIYTLSRTGRWCHNKISRLPNGDILVLYTDAAEQKALDNEALKWKKQLEQVQKIAQLGSWEWDMRTNEITWSDEVFRIFCEEPQSFTPSYERFLSYLSKEDQPVFKAAVLSALEEKKTYHFDHKVYCKNGLVRYVQGSGNALFDEQGRAISMIGTVLDITERKFSQIQLQESEEKFRKITESAFVGVFIFQEHYLYANPSFVQMSGYSVEELNSIPPCALFEQSAQQRLKQVCEKRLSGEGSAEEHNDIRLITKQGDIKTMRVMTQTIRYQGEYAGMGTMIDVTDITQAKQQLKLLAQAMEQMDEMVRITDKNGIITYVNDALVEHTGYSQIELIGKNISILKSGRHKRSFYQTLWNTIVHGNTYRGIFINKKKNHKIYYEEETITPIMDTEHTIQYYISSSQDVTERIRIEQRLQKLAMTDALTGIYNRRKINEELEMEINRARRYNDTFALLMFDIDHFKAINDTYGHDIGDKVLKKLSVLVSKYKRDSDRFGRWGGEEFILILPQHNEVEVIAAADKIRKTVSGYAFRDLPSITISVGVSVFNQDDTEESLLKRVDKALYEAKQKGRDRVVFG